MLQVVYVSAAGLPFTQAQLVALLKKSRAKNASLGVTGLLLYHAGSFLQVLEGPDAAVDALARTIAADDRHHRVRFLVRRDAPEAAFAGWSMGFVDVTRDDYGDVLGHVDYLLGLNATPSFWDQDLLQMLLGRFRAGALRQHVGTVD
ncbi:BLUF domain-containing protein [Limnoglobus roseus]|uniref:Blue light-and temperature-regulated antirepressor BluF n=1 Tax=Limnoglobus roseus TaxID=2598579 RepID=A0A5C1ART1_9BACT|nr:BLUF domain-containing protein [Limnoglobus roseus]QEL20422.1 Blue light- and temperature-regulated antirepressor BluF [Limnoglobus roseus]